MSHAVEEGEVCPLLYPGLLHLEKAAGGKTHNEQTALIKEILLQRSLMCTLVLARTSGLRTNLVFHYRVSNVVNHAAKGIRNLSVG